MSEDSKKLVSLLLDFHESGSCECLPMNEAVRAIIPQRALESIKCQHCKVADKITSVPESHFIKLREEISKS